jgi:hypothetical protein
LEKGFVTVIFAIKKTMANITYQSDKLWVAVDLSDKTALVCRRESVHDEWSVCKKMELEDESRGFFDSMEKDLSDYLRMFDDKPFGSE